MESSYNKCNICNTKNRDDSLICKLESCYASKCIFCEKLSNIIYRVPFDDLETHFDLHRRCWKGKISDEEVLSDPSLVIDEKYRDLVGVIFCNNNEIDGCGKLTSSSNDNCDHCNKALWIDWLDHKSRKRYLGQHIYFLQKKEKFIEKGIIVRDEGGGKVTIRYYNKMYRDPRYDEIHIIEEIFTTMEEAESHLKQTKRLILREINESSSNNGLSSEMPIESTSKKQRTNEGNTSSKSKKSEQKKLSNVQGCSDDAIIDDSISKHNTESSLEDEDSVFSDENLRFHRVLLTDDGGLRVVSTNFIIKAAKIVSPAISIISKKEYTSLPFDVQRGLIFVIDYWARPPKTDLELDSSAIILNDDKLKLSVSAVEDLLKYCPTSLDELALIDSCKHLLLKQNETNTKSSGEELIDLIVNYLDSKFIDLNGIKLALIDPNLDYTIEMLSAMKLRLPLTYPEFLVVMKHAYLVFGGRNQVENSRDVRGLKVMNNGTDAMYGGVMEEFIEQQLVQRTRLGKDNTFIDIGSGIGQICIQVTATVFCESIGIEIDEGRNTAGIKLIEAFDKVLEDIGAIGRIGAKTKLIHSDFAHETQLVRNSKNPIVFFNNFGPWFNSRTPGKSIDLCQEFCEHVKSYPPNVQILTLNPLVGAYWLHSTTFYSEPNSVTWSAKPLLVYFYTVPSDQGKGWTCRTCTFFNSLYTDECDICLTKRVNNSRVKGAKFKSR